MSRSSSADSGDSPEAGPPSIPALLVALLEIEVSQRPDWLRENAPAHLHDQLLVLARRADAEGTVAQTGAAFQGAEVGRDAAERVGQTVGNYRLERVIGEGGMGAVYLARREGDYEHEAAIKLARPTLVSQQVLDRLAQERQILADLDHPNIARLLDGGSTEQGEIYLVLERVEGVPITEYCWQRELPANDVVRLFHKVCDAVTAAHRALLVHGDLKPSNILVRDDGEPKLLDFGVARTLSTPQSEESVIGWTPGFASPEQIRGQRIGVASDVYSLGVLLHLLLARSLPERGKATGPGQEAQSARASTREPLTSAKTVNAVPATSAITRTSQEMRIGSSDLEVAGEPSEGLAVELVAILRRCLAIEPEHRYATVSDLAADLERYVQGLPVLAVGGGRWYVARKFVQRHRFAMAATTVAVLALLVSWGVALQQARVAREQAMQSELERQRADRTNHFLYEIFSSANVEAADPLGTEVKVVDALERAGERLWADESLLPEDRASFAVTLVDLHQSLDQDDAARRLLQRLLPYVEEHPGISALTRARTLRMVGHMRAIEFDFQAAAPLFERAIEVLLEHYGAGSEEFEVLDLELALRAESVSIFWNLDRCDEALAVVQPVLDLRDRLRSMPPDDARRLSDNLAGAISNLTSCRWAEGRFRDAFDLSLEALAFTELETTVTEQLAVMHNNSGFYAIALEDWETARRHLARAVEISSQLGVHELKNGIRLVMLARAEANLGELASAREHLEEGLEIARQVYASTPRVWTGMARGAEAAWAIGEVDRAIALFEEAIAGAERSDPESSRLAEFRGRLAQLLLSERPADPRINTLLEAATAPGRLQSTPRESRVRADLLELLSERREPRASG